MPEEGNAEGVSPTGSLTDRVDRASFEATRKSLGSRENATLSTDSSTVRQKLHRGQGEVSCLPPSTPRGLVLLHHIYCPERRPFTIRVYSSQASTPANFVCKLRGCFHARGVHPSIGLRFASHSSHADCEDKVAGTRVGTPRCRSGEGVGAGWGMHAPGCQGPESSRAHRTAQRGGAGGYRGATHRPNSSSGRARWWRDRENAPLSQRRSLSCPQVWCDTAQSRSPSVVAAQASPTGGIE